MEAMDDLDAAIAEDEKRLAELTEASIKAANKIVGYCPSDFMKIEFIADYADAVSEINLNHISADREARSKNEWQFIAIKTSEAVKDFNDCSEFYRTHRDDLICNMLEPTVSALDRMRYLRKLEEMNEQDEEASKFFKAHMLRLFKTLSEWTHAKMLKES